jgi:hypothetical protein
MIENSSKVKMRKGLFAKKWKWKAALKLGSASGSGGQKLDIPRDLRRLLLFSLSGAMVLYLPRAAVSGLGLKAFCYQKQLSQGCDGPRLKAVSDSRLPFWLSFHPHF